MKDETRQYNMKKIEQTIQEHTSLKRAKRQFILGKSQIITMKPTDGSIINDRDEIISRVEEFYQDLYSNKKKLPKPDININEDQVPDITKYDVKKTLKDGDCLLVYQLSTYMTRLCCLCTYKWFNYAQRRRLFTSLHALIRS